jgi:hypothetical protein
VNIGKLRGFSAKTPEPAGFDWLDSGDLDLTVVDARGLSGQRVRSGPSDHYPAARNACKRRETAAASGERRRSSPENPN